MELLYDPAILLLEYIPKETKLVFWKDMWNPMFMWHFHNCQNMETAESTDKQWKCYIYTNSVTKKEKKPVICYILDEPRGRYAKWNKPDRKQDTIWSHSYTEFKKKN